MTNQPLFSVLIANYNNAQYLSEALQSVYDQTYSNWEIIIVDDASTDNSNEIYDGLKHDNKIRVFLNEKNMGCGYTKRRCAELAEGEICAFLDPDDALLPNALELSVKAHWENKNASVVFSRNYLCDIDMRILKESRLLKLPEYTSYLDYDDHEAEALVSYKNSYYKKTAGLNPKYLAGVDADLNFILEEVGDIFVLDEFTYKYRKNKKDSITASTYKAAYYNFMVRFEAFARRGQEPFENCLPAFIRSVNGVKFKALNEQEKVIRSSKAYRLGKTLLSPIKCLRPLLSAIGYYKIKSAIKMHFYLKQLREEDNQKRVDIDRKIEELPSNLLRRDNELIVSLTSYSRRITETLPYTLYSLLTQEVLPGRIVVYLSKDECNQDTLPAVLKGLQNCGVEFYYVEDLRSYKKLIPALQMFPDNPILTVDDDMYYDRTFVESFLDEYQKSDKHTVLGTVGRMVTRKDGKFLPYSKWEKLTDETVKTMDISFYGCGGCLYPPHVFDGEILKKDIFMKLSPTADDLWFWVMEQRCAVKTNLLKNYNRQLYLPVDRTTWFELDREDCLTSLNDGQGKNDEQLSDLIEYYEIEN